MKVFRLKAKTRKPAVRHATHAGTIGVGGVLWGVLGWLLAIGLGLWAAGLEWEGRNSLAQPQAQRKANRVRRQAEQQERETASTARQGQLIDAINAEVAAQGKLLKQIAGATAAVSSLETEKTARETRRARLTEGQAAVKGDVDVMGEGIQELQARMAALQKEKTGLVKEYSDRYRRMKKLYEEKAARPEPEMLRQFYQTHQNTPFAPAALFFTAEKLFQKRRSADAQRFYEDLTRKFPDSVYLQPAQKRLSDIQSRLTYEPIEGLGFTPYKALRFVESL